MTMRTSWRRSRKWWTRFLNFKKLRAEAEENTKANTERKEALEKELQEVKKALTEKDAKLKGYVTVDDIRIQESYYQGQYDCIASVKLEVQQNL